MFLTSQLWNSGILTLRLPTVAEKAFRRFRYLANRHPEANFIAVSHSDQKSTDDWIIHIGGEWDVQVVVDPDRLLYAQWGLGISNTWHVFNPWSLYSAYKIGKQEGIWGTSTQSGDKWQMAGTFAVDGEGLVRWVSIAKSADDIPDFKEALRSVAEKR